MLITARLDWGGEEYGIEYHDADSFVDLPSLKITQAYGVCFCKGKLVIGQRARNGDWGHLGGHVEAGESPEQTLRREIKEESNMAVLDFAPLGYQIVTNPSGQRHLQLRYVCIAQPLGEFVRDPALHDHGGISAIQLIEPRDYKRYFDWGEIGDRLMERALARYSVLAASKQDSN